MRPILLGLLIGTILAIIAWATGHTQELDRWESVDPGIRHWYKALMQPDNPLASCCGEADAYWCDVIRVEDNRTFCTITDDRPDYLLGRPHIDVGTEIEIPATKLKWDCGNPTGHAVVFLSRQLYVYCFVQGSGI